MRQRISDLLDGCEDGGVELSGGTPLSPARIKELTMNRITPKKQKLYRLPTRLLAAAAIVAALTASALAVNYAIGAGGLMQDFFAGDGGPLSTGQIENLDQIGQTYEGGVTDNGATITPIAAIASEGTLYIRLRVESPEGVALPDLDPDTDGYYQLQGTQWPEEKMTLAFADGEEVNARGITVEWLADADTTDNVKEAVIHYTSFGIDPAVFNDGQDKVLTIHGLWIQSSHHEYTPVFTGEFALLLGSHEGSDIHIDCGGASHEAVDGYVNYLDSITLSPIDISYSFRTTLRYDNGARISGPALPGEIRIVMKDGTEYYVYGYRAENDPHEPTPGFDPDTMIADGPYGHLDSPYWPITEHDVFDQPLDLSQVDHVLFDGKYEFPISAN